MRIKIWVKAFIPNNLATADGGRLTWQADVINAIAGSNSLSMLPLIPFLPSFSASYATDQRTFSDDINASARITTLIEIDDENTITVRRYSDPTHQINHPWLNLLAFYDEQISALTSQPKGTECLTHHDNETHIHLTTSGCNPFFNYAGVDLAPSIQMSFDLIVCKLENNQIEVTLSGMVGEFPAFEGYVQFDNQPPITLLRRSPEVDKTPFNLIAGAVNPVHGKAKSSAQPTPTAARLFDQGNTAPTNTPPTQTTNDAHL